MAIQPCFFRSSRNKSCSFFSTAAQPFRCGHYFPYWSVIPPSYCPICGAYIGPIYACPQPPQPYIVYSTGTAAAPKPQGETISG